MPATTIVSDIPPVDLEHTLFERFPKISQAHSETIIPHEVFNELESDIEHVVQQMIVASSTHDQRLLLTRKRTDEIDDRIESIERYLSHLARWSPGYNSGVDGMRNSLLSSKSILEQEKHNEKIKCLEDCSRLEQSWLDLVHKYQRLKTDLGLLSQVKGEGAP